jgi:hypothetical protein
MAVIDSGLGRSAATVAYDIASHRAFIIGDTTIVLDMPSGKVASRLWLGNRGISAAVDGNGHVYVDLPTDSVVGIRTQTLSIESRWGLGPCSHPSGLAIDANRHRLFVSCRNGQMAVLDTDSGRIVDLLPMPYAATELAFDSVSRHLFNPTGAGKMVLVQEDSPDRYSVVQQIETADAGATAAVDLRTGRVFLTQRDERRLVTVLVFAP